MIHFAFLLLFLTALYFLGGDSLVQTVNSPVNVISPNHGSLDSWSPLLHLSHNAYMMWRGDPFLSNFGFSSALSFTTFSLILVYLGTVLLRRCSVGSGELTWNVVAALYASSLLFALFLQDWVILQSLSWFTLSASFLVLASRAKKGVLACIIVSLFCGLRIAKSSNQLCLALSLLTVLLALFLILTFDNEEEEGDTIIYWGIYSLALLAPSLWFIWSIPSAPLPDYPHFATLVPDDGIPGHVTPLINQYHSPPIIDRMFVKEAYGRFSILLLTLASFFALIFQFSRIQASKYSLSLSYLVLTLSLMLLLDTHLPEHLSQIAPLSVVARNLSWLQYFPLTSLVAASALILLLLQASFTRSHPLFYGTVLLLFLAPYSQGVRDYKVLDQFGSLQRHSRQEVVQSYNTFETAQALQEDSLPQMTRVLSSPSHWLVRQVGLTPYNSDMSGKNLLWPLTGRLFVDSLKYLPLSRFRAQLDASHNAQDEMLMHLMDRAKKTRWTPGRARQDGSEWLHLRFPSPIRLSGIFLNTGDFTSDFPRALELRYLSSCKAEQHIGENYVSLFEAKPWYGPLTFTEQGYPYFGNQAEVRIPLPESRLVQCLMIKQTGTAPYDWTVAELRIAVAEE